WLKLSVTVKEAVADAEAEISQEEVAQAGSGAPRPGTRQDGGAEQPDIRQRAAHVRPRDPRVRRLVLFGAPPRVQPHSRAPISHPSQTTRICAGPVNLRLAAVRRIAYE